MTTVFPQTGDPNAGELFALLLGQANTTDFVGEGLDVTVDTTADEATISSGTCYTSRETATVAGTGEVVENLGYALQFEETTVSLPHTETVLAIVPDHGATDSISVGTYQFVDDIPDSGLHIATVNRDSGDVELYNRDPDISAADLTVAGSAVVDGPLSVSDDISLDGVLEHSGETLITQDGDLVITDVGNSQLVNDSITVSADGDLSGGGAVSLGETVSLSVDTTDRYTDAEAVTAVDGEVSAVAASISGLDSQVSTNTGDISSLESDKFDSVDYNPEQDTHDRYSDSEAVTAVDEEITSAGSSVSTLDSQVSTNAGDISSLESDKLAVVDYNPEVDTHDKYTDSEAVSAVDGEVSAAAISVSGLDSTVDSNESDISSLESDKLDVVEYTPEEDTHDRYSDSEAVTALDEEVTTAATSVSGLDSVVGVNVSDISSLESDKLDSVNYTPEEDTHDQYTDAEAISAVDGEVSAAATSVSGLDSTVDSNESDISSLESDKLDVVDYNPEVDTHDRYSDSEAVSAVDSNVSDAATSVSGLDSQVSTNVGDISSLESDKFDSVNYTPEEDTHDRYDDSEAVSAVDSNVSDAATSVSGLDSQVSTNTGDISSLESDKFDSVNYTPEEDTHDRYTDAEAISAVDGEVSASATSVSGLDSQVSANESSISSNQTDISTNVDDISSLESNKLDTTDYTPEEDINSVTVSEELTIPVASEGDPAPSESSIAFDPERGVLLVPEEVN